MISSYFTSAAAKKTSRTMGQGMVEFALAIPIFLLLVWGLIEGGRLLFIYSSVMTAGREAARYAAASDNFTDCTGIQSRAMDIGFFAGIASSNIITTYDRPGGTYTSSCPPTDPQLGDRVIVDVWVDYSPIVPVGGFRPFKIESINAHTIIYDVKADR
jgi:hypothetical protein